MHVDPHDPSEKQTRLESIIEIAGLGTWAFNLQTRELIYNEYWAEMLGYTLSELQPVTVETYQSLIHPEDLACSQERLKDHIEGRTAIFHQEVRLKHKEGHWVWVIDQGKVVSFTKDDLPEWFIGSHQDITEKNSAIEKLRLREEQFRQTFDFAPNGMALVGLDGRWLRVNKALSNLLGYSANEFSGLSFQEITHSEDLEADLNLVREVLAGKRDNYTMEKRYLHKNGNTIYAILSVSIVKNQDGEPIHFVSQINDITDRKHLEIALRESNRKMKNIQDASTRVGIMETDINGQIQVFNTGAENLLGYFSEELVHKHTPIKLFLESELRERQQQILEIYGKRVEGFESLTLLLQEQAYDTYECTFVRVNQTRLIVQLTVTPIHDQLSRISGYLFIFVDISPLKAAEREIKSLLDVTREQNNRLLNFAHIVSHNLRSHSGNICMILDLMKDQAPQDIENEFYPLLQEASNNLSETIAHLNEVVLMNNKVAENLVSLNLFEYIKKNISFLSAEILENDITINNNVPIDVFVSAVPAYLESIILNFLTNSIKYKSPVRKPVIDISAQSLEKEVIIYIQDNGVGIDLKLHGNKLFGMYKTFHGNKDARGVGLFITKNQVETLGGTVDVKSKIDEGTTFIITLLK